MGSIKYRKRGGKRKYKKKTKRRRHKRKIKKTKKRKRRRSSRRRYKLKGGMACANRPVPSNIGHKYTGYKFNTNPSLPDPQSLNSNLKNVGQKGGGFLMHDFGLGDVLLNYYKGMNSMTNLKHTYKGNKPEVKADPMNQPKLFEKQILPYTTANIPDHHNKASIKAATYSIF